MKHVLIFLLALSCITFQAMAQSLIQDTDGNTKVETEATPNSDVVRITTNGLNRLNINGNAAGITTFDVQNNNQSILMGTGAGFNLTAASVQNVVVGHHAGLMMSSAFGNVYLGALAGQQTNTGSQNIAIGTSALFNNTTGGGNIAIGDQALTNLTTATSNTAVGRNALLNNTIGNYNVALGIAAGDASTGNVDCTFIGTDADNSTTAFFNNSTALGFGTRLTASNQVRIGNSSVTSIGGFANWSNISDGRIKKNIQENVPGLDFILQLRPVTYNLDINGINERLHRETTPDEQAFAREKEQVVYTGFIAQEVERTARQLHYDFSGVDAPKNDEDLYGLRYAEFVVPMVKALQEQQAQIDAQRAEIEALKSMVNQLIAVKNATLPEMQVWPNPAGETVQVSVTGAAPGATLSLYSAEGKLLRSQPALEGVQSVDLLQVNSGALILQLSVPGRQPVSSKVIKGK